tara:strand:- start:1064 stop:1252 length:189 start_codon:yes stop_codon:yes gene_type:complete
MLLKFPNFIAFLTVGVSIGGDPACYIVEHHLSRFVEGQDARNVELMWDQMVIGSVILFLLKS